MATTPMMRQYQEAKAACGDALLLFRMGDFYELFFEDAKTAAAALGLTLTARDKGENPIPMAGFPYHQLEGYLGKLIGAGFRAAVCEQVEDPKKATGLVRREVTRVVTPGTLTDDGLLDPRESNYLVAISWSSGKGATGKGADARRAGVAWCELSTGRFYAAVFEERQVADQLARIGPAECLFNEEQPRGAGPGELLPRDGAVWTSRPPWAFSLEGARTALSRHFGAAGLEGFGFEDDDAPAIQAAGAVLDYLTETQRSSLDHLDRLIPYRSSTTLEIDVATRRSLELTRTLREGRREGALIAVIDRTTTAMGARRLQEWLASPLTDREAIEQRLDAVEDLLRRPELRLVLRQELKETYDLERLLGRVATGRSTPRDLRHIGDTLARLPSIRDRLVGRAGGLLEALAGSLDLAPDLRDRLLGSLELECPLQPREGGFIRAGFSQRLDELRDLTSGGKQWIAQYQASESERTGIPNLKVGFNKVFGYYIELTNAQRDRTPPEYIRKQTIKNAERYITPELKEYEERVLSADEQSKELEYELFQELRAEVERAARRLQGTAASLATLDVLLSLAELAAQRGYCRPTLVDEPVLDICEGRHPVLDLHCPHGDFVPNDTRASEESGLVLLITGPNMAGKSTYIRQVALLTILAQMGSFVPARSATIGVADRVFARVGASDELSRGQSTFMVEMTETARILNTATGRSLVILDEIGRGTSTYDGVSLAWAIVEHIHDRIGCRTLFATHYHELTDLEESHRWVRNLNVAVREHQGHVAFLHKIVEGAADKSYGIHVARLAGIPKEVNERAGEILRQLEAQHAGGPATPVAPAAHGKEVSGGELASAPAATMRTGPKARPASRPGRHVQLTLFAPYEHPLLDALRQLDLDATTPLAALQRLQEWQRQLLEESERPPQPR